MKGRKGMTPFLLVAAPAPLEPLHAAQELPCSCLCDTIVVDTPLNSYILVVERDAYVG